MADPLSLATAVITIGGMVVTTAKLVRLLDEVNHFDKDIPKIWRRFSVFPPLINAVSMDLEKQCRNHADSVVVQYLAKSGLARGLADDSRGIREEIRETIKRFEHAATGNYITKIWWTLRHKPEIEELYPQMESLKLSLLLVQNIIAFNITDDTEEKKKLRRAMRQLETTLTIFRQEHLPEHQTITAEGTQLDRSVTSLAIDTSGLLLQLSRSLRKTEHVPGIQRVPESRPARSQPLHYRQNVETFQTFPIITEIPPPPALRRRRPGSHRVVEETGPRPESRPVIPKIVRQRVDTGTPMERQEDVGDITIESEISAQSSLLTRETSSSTAQTTLETPVTPVTPITPARAENAFEDVRERSNYHSLHLLRRKVIQGYISQPDQGRSLHSAEQLVTAHDFGADLQENFISVYKAQELGLDMRQLDPEANPAEKMVLVVTEGDRLVHRRAIGTVEVRWWTSRPPGFRLMLWVLDGVLPDGISIALGRPFDKRRRYYNRASSVREKE